jgi:hypothetical protein
LIEASALSSDERALDHRTAKRRTEIAEGRLSHVVYRSKGSASAVWPATPEQLAK